MRTFRAVWVTLFNLALILLPWVLVVALMVYFGQPMLSFYRDYFLGNPVQEIERLTADLSDRPGRELPFERLDRQYSGLGALESMSDTDRRAVRVSTIQLHHAVVSRVQAGEVPAPARDLGDSYTAFLRKDVLGRVFNRPDMVRERLLGDYHRVRRLNTLPYHPARGLEAFVDSTDTAVNLIVTYGDLYADQVTCRQVFQMDCDRVYERSVRVVGDRVGQHLTGWPQFARTLPARASVINQRMPALLEVFDRLRGRLEGYLRSPPWNDRDGFQADYRTFRRRYEENLRTWYLDALEGLELGSRRFGQEQWEARAQDLKALGALETIIQSNGSVREIFRTEEVQSRREKLVQNLRETHRWVRVNRDFDSAFRVSEEDVDLLVSTLTAFPNGEEALREDRRLLDRLREVHSGLRQALEAADYDRLTERLADLKNRLSSEDPVVWKVMLEQFLVHSRDRVTRPSWQPETQEGQEAYERLVRLYGELGNVLNLQAFDEDWVEGTLVALKSRRFNQLTYELRQRLSRFEPDERGAVRTLLEELLGLEDLTAALETRAEEALFRTVLVERIVLGEDQLFRAFRDRVHGNATWRSQWEDLDALLSEIEGRDPNGIVESVDLRDYVKRYVGWLDPFRDDGPLERLVYRKATDRLGELFRRLHGWIRVQVTEPPHHARETGRLLDALPEVLAALEDARELPEFDPAVDLTAWRSVLVLRSTLDGLREPVRTMKKGQLVGGDPKYETYRRRLKEFRYRSLPESYDPAVEEERLRSLHESIVEKARAIERSSREDWLAGWGGRLRGDDILSPWEAFLREIRDATRKPSLGDRARTLYQNAREVRQNW